MDKAYIAKNVAHCENRIESFEARVKNAKETGEDVDWLKSEIDGYKKLIKELAQSDSN